MKIILSYIVMVVSLMSAEITVTQISTESLRVTNYTKDDYTVFYDSQEIEIKPNTSLLIECKSKEFVYIEIMKKDKNTTVIESEHIPCSSNVGITTRSNQQRI